MFLKTRKVRVGLVVLGLFSLIFWGESCTKETLPEELEATEVEKPQAELDISSLSTVNISASLMVYPRSFKADTGREETPCHNGPGFCGTGTPPVWPRGGSAPTGDAEGEASIDLATNTLQLRFTTINQAWFAAGGYLDGTFSTQTMQLDPSLTAALGANSVTLQDGVYNMVLDVNTGDQVVAVDAIIQ